MHVRTANGESVAISEVADIQLGLGLTAINRIDRDRTVTISADADATKVQTGEVIGDLTENYIPELLAKYPGLKFGLGGASEEERELVQRTVIGFVASTFVGLLPMLFETSMQAQFVIPMALSLSFSIVFATTITLVLVPCLYRVIYDLRDSKRFSKARPRQALGQTLS